MTATEAPEFGANSWLVDELARRYEADPASVGPEWRAFFDGISEDGSSLAPTPTPPTAPIPAVPVAEPVPDGWRALGGPAAALARHMEASLQVPTATSVRTVPAKLLEVNRRRLNRHLARVRVGRVSFTHLIAWAVVRSAASTPAIRRGYTEVDGRPGIVTRPNVDLGIAVDVERSDGGRTLLVPTIREAETLGFGGFIAAYEELVAKARTNRIAPDDLAGTTITVTNPGTIGTTGSVPRLPAGGSAIVGIGAVGFPPEYAGADPQRLADLGVGKVVTLTSTYDHRVIQGAESGGFLRRVESLLLGEDDFYGEVFAGLHVPFRPIRWGRDEQRAADPLGETERHARVLQLINNYRVRGHLIAHLDPLATLPPQTHPELDPATLGFSIWDLDRRFATGGLAGMREASLEDIWDVLRDAYCGTLGVEYMHIQEPPQKAWIQERVEGVAPRTSPEHRDRILHKLIEAEAFERFLHTKYVGHKRFSLEGAESLIPMLEVLLDEAADDGVTDVVVGMSHRGRLNVLANIIGKSYGEIFREFEGEMPPDTIEGTGDVKYHLGASGTHASPGGRSLAVRVASNPSHLESVDPVVEGMARATLDAAELDPRAAPGAVLPVLIHGEAAFAGQGVVAETLNLSQLPGYRTGGTVHLVVNNQLGFTTPTSAGRSSTYPTDVAKMVQAPIFHVNGDDPEGCIRAVRLAFAFRQTFGKDVVIDMWCYRRWGHNEADEPSFTQPLMYRRIRELPSVRTRYTEALIAAGRLSPEEADRALQAFNERLAGALEETRQEPSAEERGGDGPHPRAVPPWPPTRVPRAVLDRVVDALTSVPEGFHLHPKIAAGLARRRAGLSEDAVDWALGELLAFGTLLQEGVTVRSTGQDTRRGTFSQRHAVFVDQETGAEHEPLATLGRAFVYDSSLSEFAALGFEYGYSVSAPRALVLWEAQFGDFANGGQIVIDQYIAAAEEKWGQVSNLVLLLPHGYEGQGPEHSSARLERFLQLAMDTNLQVVVPSTPAQHFHLLRGQALRERRVPLVVATPKSLLRLAAARSSAADLTDGAFRPVLADPRTPEGGSTVLLCQGKLFYELDEARAERGAEGVALVRLERCAPFPAAELQEELARHPVATVRWVQEEPANMGAGPSVLRHLRRELGLDVPMVARPESASPATGSLRRHRRERSALLARAFAG